MDLSAKTYRFARKPHRYLAIPPILSQVRCGISDGVHGHKNLLHGTRGFYMFARNADLKERPFDRTLETLLNVREPHSGQQNHKSDKNIKPPDRDEPGNDKFE